MHMKIGTMVAATMLAACGSASEGAAKGNASAAATRRLDVAGLVIGMSAGDALAKLRTTGWKAEPFAGKDWKAVIDERARRERNAALVEQPRNGVETINASKGRPVVAGLDDG